MDTSTALEASSSPSSSSTTTTSSSSPYDVFLSFSGEDTRKTFTDHLYWTMKDAGIDFFMEENESIRRGENISDKVKQIIEGSRVSVIVFSSRYADSIWCLEELVQIMECRRTLKQMVLPIFYDLSPSDGMGTFVQAFQKHRERFHEDPDIQEKIWRWTNALTEAAGLTVWVFETTNGYEGMFIREIVDEITRQLKSPTPVGIAFSELQRLHSPKLEDIDSTEHTDTASSGSRAKSSLSMSPLKKRCHEPDHSDSTSSKSPKRSLTPEVSTLKPKPSQVEHSHCGDRSSEDSGESRKTQAFKDRRGCYKRRKTCQSWKVISSKIEDGQAWRQYGQKIIVKAPYPRAYYRCTRKFDQGCKATKQVEQIQDNPIRYLTTYIGEHTCRVMIKPSPMIIGSNPWESQTVSSESGTPHPQNPSFVGTSALSILIAKQEDYKVGTPSDLTDDNGNFNEKHPVEKVSKAEPVEVKKVDRDVKPSSEKAYSSGTVKTESKIQNVNPVKTEKAASVESVKVEKVQKTSAVKVEKVSKAEPVEVKKVDRNVKPSSEKAYGSGTVKTERKVQNVNPVKTEKAASVESVKVEKVAKDVKKPALNSSGPPKLTSMIKCNDTARDKVRVLLHEALSKVSEEGDERFVDEVNAADPIGVAVTVESVLFENWGGSTGSQKAKYRSLIFNLKDQKNPDFRRKVLLGHIEAERLVDLSTAEMASDQRQEENQKLEQKALFECERGGAPKATTDQFKCGRCGQRKTTYYQMQTRSADEPMTTYVTCVNCNNRWKFC